VAGSLADRRAAKASGRDREFSDKDLEAMRVRSEKERDNVMRNETHGGFRHVA
jgi:hypothetical protein